MTGTDKFANIIGLELDLRTAKSERERVGTYTSHAHKQEMNATIVDAERALYAALNGLTLDEMKAYGEYRAQRFNG